jgi:putative transposase
LRPLEAVYPIVYFDALMIKVREDRSVRSRACYLAVGVTCEGDREALGIWWQDTQGSEFWLAVLNDVHRRGTRDVLIACVDGLAGFPGAIGAVFPAAWEQTCIVHCVPGAWAPSVVNQSRCPARRLDDRRRHARACSRSPETV